MSGRRQPPASTPLAVWIAASGGAGYFPIAPGTAGSAVGVAFFVGMRWAGVGALFEAGLIIALFALGCWAGSQAEHHFGFDDPGPVVIDEVVGQLITLAFLPVSWMGMLFGFLVFRVLDIVKPYPARQFEQLHGGLGIMADDAMAGVYGQLIVRLAAWAVPAWILT